MVNVETFDKITVHHLSGTYKRRKLEYAWQSWRDNGTLLFFIVKRRNLENAWQIRQDNRTPLIMNVKTKEFRKLLVNVETFDKITVHHLSGERINEGN